MVLLKMPVAGCMIKAWRDEERERSGITEKVWEKFRTIVSFAGDEREECMTSTDSHNSVTQTIRA